MSALFDIFNNNAALQAANYIGGGVQQGQAQALPWYLQGIGAIQQGIGNAGQAQGTVAQTAATGAGPSWQNFATAQPGVGMYGNALGLNGPAGSQQAYDAFTRNPGYQASLGASNAGVNAAQAAAGGTGSGNAILAAQRNANNLASQGWQNYVSNLAPYLNMSQNAAGTLAGTYGTLGGEQVGLTGQQTGLYGTEAGAYQLPGNMFYGGALTSAQAQANAALAQNQGSANIWNALINGGAGLLGYLSDIRVKEDVAPVGELASGETVYRYRYRGDPRFQIGLIAQEVEDSTPEAVFDAVDHLKGVDYRRATERAAKILEFTRQRPEPPPMHRPFGEELMELAA